MKELGWLIENVPIAAALIIMTRMWLTHLKSTDDRTREAFKEISKECEIRAADNKAVITDNTRALTKMNAAMDKYIEQIQR